jgi:hypothetical protein
MSRRILVQPVGLDRQVMIDPFFESADYDTNRKCYRIWTSSDDDSWAIDEPSMIAILKEQGYQQHDAVENTNIPAIDEITPILAAMKGEKQ